MTHWSERYLKIPFIDGGRDHRGCDCWGLVRMVLHEQCGILVPSYGDISARDLARIGSTMQVGANDEEWRAVETPREFDFVVMRWFARPSIGHVGVMVDTKHVLHTEERSGPVIVSVAHHSISRRIAFLRRHKRLAHEHA